MVRPLVLAQERLRKSPRFLSRLERATAGFFFGSIVMIALGSAWNTTLASDVSSLRWLFLATFMALACALAALSLGPDGLRPAERRAGLCGGVLIVLSLGSTGWSVDPRITLERSGTFTILLLAAGAAAVAAARRPDFLKLLLRVTLWAVATLVLASFVLLLFDTSAAIEAGPGLRVRGIEQNPDTLPLLGAYALPIGAWMFAEARGRRRQLIAAAVVLTFVFIGATASRGGVIAAVAGCTVVAAATARSWRRAVVPVAVVLAALAVVVVVAPKALKVLGVTPTGLPTSSAPPFAAPPTQTTTGPSKAASSTTTTSPSATLTSATTSGSATINASTSTTPGTTAASPTTSSAGSATTSTSATGSGAATSATTASTLTTSTTAAATSTTTTAATTRAAATGTTTTAATTTAAATTTTPAQAAAARRDAEINSDYPLPMNYEVGRPAVINISKLGQHPLLGTSGRIGAWLGAIGQADQRPLLGYGFGTEDHVFINRYYDFQSTRAENSWIGFYLQMGIAGVAALTACLGFALLFGIRSLLTRSADQLRLAACVGVVVAGCVEMLVQSYVYSAGDIATLTFWTTVALLVTTSGSDERAPAAS